MKPIKHCFQNCISGTDYQQQILTFINPKINLKIMQIQNYNNLSWQQIYNKIYNFVFTFRGLKNSLHCFHFSRSQKLLAINNFQNCINTLTKNLNSLKLTHFKTVNLFRVVFISYQTTRKQMNLKIFSLTRKHKKSYHEITFKGAFASLQNELLTFDNFTFKKHKTLEQQNICVIQAQIFILISLQYQKFKFDEAVSKIFKL
eukprot:TRINITY_DN1218_c1_g1_i12.p1 TRINITY_DN1218_c1_g1~~TRINITY_DN1218_c1_g1_i12.p1  ORF type:complete len:202 (+),score=-12.71 TRINITY_DN1218_c1_g1_i12:110-715(+)